MTQIAQARGGRASQMLSGELLSSSSLAKVQKYTASYVKLWHSRTKAVAWQNLRCCMFRHLRKHFHSVTSAAADGHIFPSQLF